MSLPTWEFRAVDSGISPKYMPTMEELPPWEFRPRISYSCSPGPPVLRTAIPGTERTRLSTSTRPREAIWEEVTAEMLIAVV